jgi:hypothetical protein
LDSQVLTSVLSALHEQGKTLPDQSLIETIQAITIFAEYAAVHNGKHLKVISMLKVNSHLKVHYLHNGKHLKVNKAKRCEIQDLNTTQKVGTIFLISEVNKLISLKCRRHKENIQTWKYWFSK